MKIRALYIAFLLSIACYFGIQAFASTDNEGPTLEISTPSGHIRDSFVILHGMAIDESGIQKVLINGEETSGTFTNIHYFWIKEVNLTEGVNTFSIEAFDDSPQHNSVEEEFVLWYHPETYRGPTIMLIPVDSLPSNNATIRCLVNPNGYATDVYLSYAEEDCDHAPFNSGRGGWCPTLTGHSDIMVNFTFEREEQPRVGSTILYTFKAENERGFAYSEVGRFIVTEPVELPPQPDTTPPESIVWDAEGRIPKPYVLIHGRAWDESGIKNVTVNGESVTGTRHDNYFSWRKWMNLTEGPNAIKVTAFDDSENQNAITNTYTIYYIRTGYRGPQIRLIPFEDLPIDYARISCIITPGEGSFTHVYRDTYSSTGSSGGQTLGNFDYDDEFRLNYIFPQGWLSLNENILMFLKVSYSDWWDFAEANFTIVPPDYVPPTIKSIEPTSESIGVPLDTLVYATLDEHLDEFTVNESTATLNYGEIPCQVEYNHAEHRIIITPETQLEFGTTYTAVISSAITDYYGNHLKHDYMWNFTTVEVNIDSIIISDDHCDPGTTEIVNIHASWTNGSDISLGTIFVDETPYALNETGWIAFLDSSDELGETVWTVTGVNCSGLVEYIQTVENPRIVRDMVEFIDPGFLRCDVGVDSIVLEGFYVHDLAPFQGSVILNYSRIQTETGLYGYRVMGISDSLYGLSVFSPIEFGVICDRINFVMWISDDRIDTGSEPEVTVTGEYEYDSTTFTGSIVFDQPLTHTVGEYSIEVEEILDPLYGLTVFSQNEVTCVWDEVIVELSLSDTRMDVGEKPVLSHSAHYAFDSQPFSGEMNIAQPESVDNVGDFMYEVSSVEDTLHGLSAFSGEGVLCVWDRIKISDGGVSRERTAVNNEETVWFRAEYEYDSEVLDGSKGMLFLNGEPMVWSAGSFRWEARLSSDEPQTITFQITGVRDDIYGLVGYLDEVGSLSVEWQRRGIPGYPNVSIAIGLMLSTIIMALKRALNKDYLARAREL